ncbi:MULTISPECIES: hypothetical protein [unclassified Mycoplasma]|uniref:hypothetical protein n=1 Tax=Mycoplasma sp. 125 TaxID=3447505 RepID=UPI003F65F1D5
MNNRKQELRKLKRLDLHSSWYSILTIAVIIIVWALIIYMVTIFENKYSSDSTFKIFNDITVSIIAGLISGILSILLAFIFLDLIKRAKIKDYYSYYCYLKSMANKSKFVFLKDPRIPFALYSKKEQELTKNDIILITAEILGYSHESPHFKNLEKEIETDFAMHSFMTPDFIKQKKIAILRILMFDILIPLAIMSILIASVIIFYNRHHEEKNIPLSAISRMLIIIISNVFSLAISTTIYEFYILKQVKNYQTFNDFYLLSFNNFGYKFLNSSIVRNY